MVHLAKVHTSDPLSPIKRIDSIKLETTDDDDFYSSVYGTRFAAEQLPQTEMPEREMPREVAYRMIKDELSLDGNPMLKYVPPFSLPIQSFSFSLSLLWERDS